MYSILKHKNNVKDYCLLNQEIKIITSIMAGKRKDFEHVRNILREKVFVLMFICLPCC